MVDRPAAGNRDSYPGNPFPVLSLSYLVVLVTFLGAYWFVNGLFGLFSLAADRSNEGWKILFGILGVIAGLAVLGYPVYSAFIVPFIFIVMIGIWGMIMGFVSLFAAFRGGGAELASSGPS